MYIAVCVATLTSRVGTKLHCQLEPENSLCKKAIIVKTKGDTVGHVPDILAHAVAPEISGGNIVSIQAIVTGEPRSAPGSIEAPCKYLIYVDKKLKSKIRIMLRIRKASM